MRGRKEKKAFALKHRRELISEYYLKHISQEKISKILLSEHGIKVSTMTICRDIKVIEKEWTENTIENRQLYKEQILRKYNMIEKAAWASWGKSNEDAETIIQEYKDSSEKEIEKVVQKLEGQSGDSKFLAIILRCQVQKRELMGLDKPKQTLIGGIEGSPVEFADRAKKMTDEELAAFVGKGDMAASRMKDIQN